MTRPLVREGFQPGEVCHKNWSPPGAGGVVGHSAPEGQLWRQSAGSLGCGTWHHSHM